MGRSGTVRYLFNLVRFAAVAVAVGALAVLSSLSYGAALSYTRPHRETVETTPASVGLAYEDVRLDADDGVRLAAWYVPPEEGAALILLHGIGSNRSGTLALARDLADWGYGLLLLDLRAHGDSEGQVSTLGVHEVRDVEAAVRFLKGRPEVDPERLGIWGGSLGAAVAITAAAALPELKAVVADSPFASAEWLVEHQFNRLVRMPAWAAPLVVRLGAWQAGVDPADVAPVRYVARISPRPLLLVHGEGDSLLLVENARMLFEAAREPKQLWIVEGAEHAAAHAMQRRAYLARVGCFFDRALLPDADLQAECG